MRRAVLTVALAAFGLAIYVGIAYMVSLLAAVTMWQALVAMLVCDRVIDTTREQLHRRDMDKIFEEWRSKDG